MHIWVDADACPGVVKDILFKAARRTKLPLTLLANHSMRIPADQNIKFLHVEGGFDVADNAIVMRASPGDLVITADIPLAAELVGNGVTALNPRGELYTTANIRQRLNMRDFMSTLRDTGVQTGGSAPFNHQDKAAFANALDRWIANANANANQ